VFGELHGTETLPAGFPGGVILRGTHLSWAALSACGVYRYALGRVWDAARPSRVMVMLNPSTADEGQSDATLNACRQRAAADGFGGLTVVNLFAFRGRHPAVLRGAADPVGPLNDAAILAVTQGGGPVLCGWGAGGGLRDRGASVAWLLRDRGCALQHLSLTRGGQPRHPLYLGRGVAVRDWPVGDSEAGHDRDDGRIPT
jgi:hypothetical protein